MEKIKRKNKSIRSKMILYIGSSLVIAFLIYMLAMSLINNAMLDLMYPRPDALAFVSGTNVSITFNGTGTTSEIMNQRLFDFLKNLRTILPVFIFAVSVIIGIFLFYKKYLHDPLTVLDSGITKIRNNDLNFEMQHDSDTELGRLCDAFDIMRAELRQTFESLWETEENQRMLYRAFAHDLRTPLTIMKGNNDIIKYIAAKNEDWEQTLQAIDLSDEAIARIESYTEQLKELESIESFQPAPERINLPAFTAVISRQVQVLAEQYQKKGSVTLQSGTVAEADKSVIMRILDNLIMNALQYAKSEIMVEIAATGEQLQIAVSDDGKGFDKEMIRKACIPFFTSDQSGMHTGLGLTIAHKLVQRCGGTITLENRAENNGAQVKITIPV